jgi:hypothetical protein
VLAGPLWRCWKQATPGTKLSADFHYASANALS